MAEELLSPAVQLHTRMWLMKPKPGSFGIYVYLAACPLRISNMYLKITASVVPFTAVSKMLKSSPAYFECLICHQT